MGADALGVAVEGADVPTAARVRSTWARLIHKVYEVDPLECPKCKGPMRVISLIEDSEVIRRILRHLGLWAPHNPRKGFTDRLRPPCRDHLQTP